MMLAFQQPSKASLSAIVDVISMDHDKRGGFVGLLL